MANFAPRKNRFLALLDQNLELFGVAGRFIDYGAGSPDVGEHIVSGERMDRGIAYDPSYTETMPRPRQGLHPDLAFTKDVSDTAEEFDRAVLFDVIEHVPDAAGTLQDLHRLVRKEGWHTFGMCSAEPHIRAAEARGVKVLPYELDAEMPQRFRTISLFHVIEHEDNLGETLARLDRLGLMNYRWVRESNFSPEYSFFTFVQTIANALLPFQRDSFYRVLRSQSGSTAGWLAAGITVVLGVALLPLFLVYQPITSLRRRGCMVAQTFKEADLAPQ
ncbi:MAG: methyltransferase domain-containing protein [Deltaproteobacteria bacterium]